MIDEKAPQQPPPSYSYPQAQTAQSQQHPPSQASAAPGSPYPPSPYPPPQGPPHQPQHAYSQPGPPQPQHAYSQGSFGPQSGYMTAPQQQPGPALSPGAQYQQQLYALCAAGNHDVTTKYGVAGIITAILCFPIGLICLFADSEKRCARCGSRVG